MRISEPPAARGYLRDERIRRDREAASYDRGIADYQHLLEWRSVWKRLSRGFHPGSAVLDCGCGTGRFTERLRASGARTVGVDLSFASLEVARARHVAGPMWLAQADVRALPFGGGTFAQVLCSEVLGQLLEREDAVALLGELRRVLRPGGRLVITTYNYWLGARFAGDKVQSDPTRTCHVRVAKREFRELLQEIFPPAEIIAVRGILHFVGKPCPAWRFLPPRLWPALAGADLMVEASPIDAWFGRLLLADIRKRDGVR